MVQLLKHNLFFSETRYQEKLRRDFGCELPKVLIMRNIEVEKYVLMTYGKGIVSRRQTLDSRPTSCTRPVRQRRITMHSVTQGQAQGTKKCFTPISNKSSLYCLLFFLVDRPTSTAAQPQASFRPEITSTPTVPRSATNIILKRINAPVPAKINEIDVNETINAAVSLAGHNDGVIDLIDSGDGNTHQLSDELNFTDARIGSMKDSYSDAE